MHLAPQPGSVSMVPFPSEFPEKVNSLMKVGEKVLIKLTAPVLLGLDQRARKRSRFPSNGELKCQGMWVPRKLR